MNTMLNTMAFDDFELASNEYLANSEGSGFIGAVCEGFIGAAGGVTVGATAAPYVALIPGFGWVTEVGMGIVGGIAGGVTGAYHGWTEGA